MYYSENDNDDVCVLSMYGCAETDLSKVNIFILFFLSIRSHKNVFLISFSMGASFDQRIRTHVDYGK